MVYLCLCEKSEEKPCARHVTTASHLIWQELWGVRIFSLQATAVFSKRWWKAVTLSLKDLPPPSCLNEPHFSPFMLCYTSARDGSIKLSYNNSKWALPKKSKTIYVCMAAKSLHWFKNISAAGTLADSDFLTSLTFCFECLQPHRRACSDCVQGPNIAPLHIPNHPAVQTLPRRKDLTETKT